MSDLGYLQRLLDGAAVEWVPLGEVCAVKTGPNINKAMIAQSPGPYPVINSGREPLGYFDQWNTEKDPIGITSRGAGVGLVTWTNGRFFRGNLNYSCAPKMPSSLNTRFLYHFLLFSEAEIQSLATYQGIPALNASALKKLPIPIPCPDDPQKSLAIQGEIVRILDAFTALTAELTAELTARKTQYNHYRNQLLSFEGGDVEWKTLGEVTRIRTGQSINKNMIADNPGEYPVINSGREPLGYFGEWNTDNDPIGITSRGAGVGSVTWRVGKYFRGNLNYSVTIKEPKALNVRFLYHILEQFQPQIKQLCTFDGIPALNARNLVDLSIPLPAPGEQARIATILDKFDTLTTSLAEGLPREIALRTAQYEHYRNLLLGFPKGDKA